MQRLISLILLGTAFAALSVSAKANADPSQCGNCHDPSEFEGMAPAEVKEALADPGIPAHGKWAGLSEEEVKALLEVLAE